MSSTARIGQSAQMDFVPGQMTSRRWDLSLVLVDGQACRIMPTRAMCRPTVRTPSDISAGRNISKRVKAWAAARISGVRSAPSGALSCWVSGGIHNQRYLAGFPIWLRVCLSQRYRLPHLRPKMCHDQCGPRKVLPPASSPLSCSIRPTLHCSFSDLWTLPDFTSLRFVPMMMVPPVICNTRLPAPR
jgi:hypothetical protein